MRVVAGEVKVKVTHCLVTVWTVVITIKPDIDTELG